MLQDGISPGRQLQPPMPQHWSLATSTVVMQVLVPRYDKPG